MRLVPSSDPRNVNFAARRLKYVTRPWFSGSSMARRQRRFRRRCRSQVDARFDNQQEDAATLLVSMQHDGMFNTGDFSCELPDKTRVHISGHQDSSRWNTEECFESWQKSFRVTCMKSGKEVATSGNRGESCFPSGQKSRPPGCYQHQPHEPLEGYDIAVL